MPDEDVKIRFGAEIASLTASMAQVREVLQGLSAPIRAIRDNLGELAEAFIAAFAVEKIAHFAEQFAELGTQTQRTAALLGVSGSEVAGLGLLARASGGSLEGLTVSAERLGLRLARAGAGSEQQRAALKALGLQVDDIKGKKFEDQLAILADRLAVLKDGTEKDAIAMALLGRAGAQTIPIFNQGAAAVRQFAEIAERAGSAMSQDQLEAAERLHMGFLELSAATTGAGNAFMTVFEPAVSGAVQIITDLIESFTRSVKEGGLMKVAVVAIAVAFQTLDVAVAVAVGFIETLWSVIKDGVFVSAELIMYLGRILQDVVTFSFSEIAGEWEKTADQMRARAKVSATNMEEIFKNLVKELQAAFGTAAEDHKKIEQSKVAKLDILNKQALAARLAEIDTEIKVLQQALERKKIILDGEVQRHGITQDQKFAALLRETEAEYQAELALLQKKEEISRADVVQHQKARDQMRLLEEKHQTDMLRLSEQSIAAQQKAWEGYFGAVTSAFNSQLRGLLTGTTTWAQAMKNILLDLTIKFIEMVEKWVVEWASGELAKTTATTEGVAARGTAQAAGAVTGMAIDLGAAMTSIKASVGQVFAGVSAFLAPALGPAAPAAATGVATGVEGVAMGIITQAAVGGFVLSDGLIYAHANEQIVPAAMSQPYSGPDMRSGGRRSGDVHLHVKATDSRDVARMFNGSKHHLRKTLDDMLKSGQFARAT